MADQVSAHVLELHSTIKDDIEKLAPSHPSMTHVVSAIPAAAVAGLSALAQAFVPMLTEMALAKIAVPVEAFVASHKADVRKFVSEKALEYADKLIKDLEDLPAPTPAPAPGPVVPG
jgi:hypothetical protein